MIILILPQGEWVSTIILTNLLRFTDYGTKNSRKAEKAMNGFFPPLSDDIMAVLEYQH